MKQIAKVVEAMVAPKAESSVEITTDSKGVAKLTVKVYAEDASEALQQALVLYTTGVVALKQIPVPS